MKQKSALLLGSTGLVGNECLQLLLNADYTKVTAPTRKPLAVQHALLENPVVDFEQLEKHAAAMQGTHVFCAIGSTMAKAGSKEAFRKIDFDIPVRVAEIAKRNGAEKFVLVSALGADARSSVFYNRVKGEAEDAIRQLGFASTVFLRPSILLGDRNEQRPGERVAQWVAVKLPFLFSGPLKNYKGIRAATVARAMLKLAQANTSGLMVVENNKIFEWGA